MSNPIRVLIADDHPIFRHGLRQIIEQAPQLLIVEEAEDGETAWRKLLTCGAQVAVLDIDMPGRDGFEVARAIRDQRLKVAVVFLTMHKDERFLNQALDLEVKGYVLKDGALPKSSSAFAPWPPARNTSARNSPPSCSIAVVAPPRWPPGNRGWPN